MTKQCRLLATVLACLCLAGCSEKQARSGSGADVEVALFQGGYGIDFFETAAREYESKHPNVKLRVWGNPRIWEQLRPRFVAGTPPDLTWPGWDMDYWSLIYEDQVIPLDEYLATPAYDGKGKWIDAFEPSLMTMGQYDGKRYMLPYFFNVMGWWYNPKLFADHGWSAPKTFEELLALCDKIKAAGIAPITFQGKYPQYVLTGLLYPWAISIGGVEAFNAAQELRPGAWKSQAFLQAAKMIKQLRDRGFFQEGAVGMSHTEAQMEFVGGRAAMIPCGTWLHSEMSKQLPPRFEMQYMPPPIVAGGTGDPTAICIGIEPWVVPSKGKHRDIAIDFYKYLTTPEKAKQFVSEKGTLMSVRGSDQTNIPSYLTGAAAAFRNSKAVWSIQFTQWYPSVGKALENAMTALLNGEATPEQFVRRAEDAAEKVRQDASIPKHRVVRD